MEVCLDLSVHLGKMAMITGSAGASKISCCQRLAANSPIMLWRFVFHLPAAAPGVTPSICQVAFRPKRHLGSRKLVMCITAVFF